MALTADQIMALNFHDYHQMILPYLNGGGMGMKLLWENSDPTSAFSAGSVALSSDDYDLLLTIYRWSTTSDTNLSVVSVKGQGISANLTSNSSNNVARIYERYATITDSTHIAFSDCTYTGGTTDNRNAIPYRIYGIKVYNRDVQSDYEIIDGKIDSIGANAKKTITLSPTIPTGKKVIGWSMYALDSDLQTYMQYYGGDYILCVKNIGNSAMTNKDYRVVFIYGQ